MALRLGAKLMSGVVRVYSYQFSNLCDKAKHSQSEFVRKQRNIGRNAVTLPSCRQTATDAAITLPQRVCNFNLNLIDGFDHGFGSLINEDIFADIDSDDYLKKLQTERISFGAPVTDVDKANITLPDNQGLQDTHDDNLVRVGHFFVCCFSTRSECWYGITNKRYRCRWSGVCHP